MSRRNAGATDAVVDAPSPARRTMPHGPQHAQALRSHHVRRSVALAATAVVAFVGAGAATAAYTLSGNIESTNVDDALAHVERPTPPPADPNAGTPLNIVLLGIDSRDGDNINFASAENTAGARSDTTMVMHISADRDRVELISIPRDSTVSMPGCPLKDDKMSSPMSSTKFNSAFAVGYDYGGSVTAGATCTLTTIESLTDVRMDGFITIDFAGFQRMVDALGGVDICIPEAIDAPDAGLLKLDAGEQHLDGTQALQFARARKGKGLGDGSDLGRIGRQQQLMAALSSEVLSKNLLTDSPALLSFLGATTSSMTMSSNFSSVQGLMGLAYSLRNVHPDTIVFMTVPYGADPHNKNNVVWTSQATQMWQDVRNDLPANSFAEGGNDPLPASDATASSDATPGGTPSGGATTTPTPTPAATREAGREPFTGADTTAVCTP